MDVGLLWFDPSPKLTTQAKLAHAAARFAERFGRPANCCHVHPDHAFEDPSVLIVPNPSVQPHHLWVGHDPSLVAPEAPVSKKRRAVAAASRERRVSTAKDTGAARPVGTAPPPGAPTPARTPRARAQSAPPADLPRPVTPGRVRQAATPRKPPLKAGSAPASRKRSA